MTRLISGINSINQKYMPSKTKTDVQINTSYWILIFRTNNKKTENNIDVKNVLYFSYLMQPCFIYLTN